MSSPTKKDLQKELHIIVAIDEKNGIGLEGKIPWKEPEDMKFFKELTTGTSKININAVLMGYKTWLSIGKQLDNRINIVISKVKLENVLSFSTLEKALQHLNLMSNVINNIFIIGGAKLYTESLRLKDYKIILHRTSILGDYNCDVFFPEIDKKEISLKDTKQLSKTAIYNKYEFVKILDPQYTSNDKTKDLKTIIADETNINTTKNFVNNDEIKFLQVVRDIIDRGKFKFDRTLVGTFYTNGIMLRFDISKYLPVITTKDVYVKGVIWELIWMIQGRTDSKWLEEKKVNIWKDNSTLDFLSKNIKDKEALKDYKEGECGPIYGFQWRHFGAKYIDCKTNYKGQGIDQLKNCIEELKNNPASRRVVMSGWNPIDLPKMCLPPCHVLYQWSVDTETKELSCTLYMRSNDLGAGAPFNITSVSLLTNVIANICNLKPKEIIYVVHDAHVYKNHVDAFNEQLRNKPYEFPILKFSRKLADIDDLKFEDLIIENYNHHKKIKMQMNA